MNRNAGAADTVSSGRRSVPGVFPGPSGMPNRYHPQFTGKDSMHTITRTLLAATAAFVLTAPSAVLAQNPPAGNNGPGRGNWNPEQMVERRVSMLDRQLNLTSDQEKKITEILKKAYQPPSQGNNTQGNTGNRAASRRDRLNQDRNANSSSQREKTDAEIKKVLTPEQAKKYASLPRGGMRGGMGMSVEDRVEQYNTRLKLNADQKKKLQTILERQDTERRASFEKMRESSDREASRETMMKTMQAQNEKFTKEIDSILTAGQKKEHAAMQKEFTDRMRSMGRNGQGGQGGQRRGGQQ